MSIQATHLIFLYPLLLVFLFFWKPRTAILFFFATKLTIDLFWSISINGSVSVLQIVAVLFPILGFYYFAKHPTVVYEHAYLKWIILLIGINIVSAIWGLINSHFHFFSMPASPQTLTTVLNWFFRFLCQITSFLLVPLLLKDVRIILKITLISTIVPVVIAFVQLTNDHWVKFTNALSHSYAAKHFVRLDGGYHDAGTLALVVFIASLISVFLLLYEQNRYFKILYGIYFVLACILLYFTFTRAFWIGIAGFLLIFFTLERKFLAIGILIVVLSVISVLPLTYKRFENELAVLNFTTFPSVPIQQIKKLGAGRIGLWNVAIEHYSNLDFVSKVIGSGGQYGSHNQFIAWVLRNGLVGLVFFTGILYKIFALVKNQRSTSEKNLILSLFITVALIINCFSQPLDNVTFGIFLCGLIGVQLKKIDKT